MNEREAVGVLLESGARNSKRDKEAIVVIVNAALDQLDASDQESILHEVVKRLGIKLRKET